MIPAHVVSITTSFSAHPRSVRGELPEKHRPVPVPSETNKSTKAPVAQGAVLSGESELQDKVLLVDVIPLSMGIETIGEGAGGAPRCGHRTSPIPSGAQHINL